jgi:arginine decarboxylase
LNQQIIVISGVGEGFTALSAFDDALHKMGIGNLNLIELSSVIPKKTSILIQERYNLPHKIGQMQPVVISHTETDEKDLEISAGLGWALGEEGGVFIEISGCFTEQQCLDKISNSLNEMRSRRSWNWEARIDQHTVSTTVKKNYSSVIVCAVYPFYKL